MSIETTPSLMTTEQLLDLPEDGMDRELIRGELRERPMTTRNPEHTSTEARVATRLVNWLDLQPEPRGSVHSGEVGVRIRRNPDTFIGIDVAYFAHGTPIGSRGKKRFFDGPPVLAVEVLSPSDQHDDAMDKVAEYLAHGVKLVWVVESRFRTVTVYLPDTEPAMFTVSQEIDGGPHLPGFRARVAEFFDA